MVFTRGVRGAISVEADNPESITQATVRLLNEILHANPSLVTPDIASIFFTMTDDLSSIYPAQAARQVGWEDVPMLCVREMNIDGTLPLIIRVLLHWNTALPQSAVHHIYLDRAAALRPDLAPVCNQAHGQVITSSGHFSSPGSIDPVTM